FSDDDLDKVIIINNTLFRHKVLRINYTTYDGRRAQDSLNPRTHADVLLLAHEDPNEDGTPTHPYWYARIIGVFHAKVLYNDPQRRAVRPRDMDFLWIRWLGPTKGRATGWAARRLPQVSFVIEKKDPSPAFGFLDPSVVIRGIHLIPDFAHGTVTNGIRKTITRQAGMETRDWAYFYLNV
ncbi:hypothetical protein BKA70DRAFT_1098711, partial [Coprinopsis sp. MPI-PUGE-AT-0042]